MTLNSFLVSRWTSTFLPLGAPAISSTAHCPWTVVHPATPVVSKSNLSVGTLSGTLSSSAALAGENRSEEHTSELQSRPHLVCRLLLEKKIIEFELDSIE